MSKMDDIEKLIKEIDALDKRGRTEILRRKLGDLLDEIADTSVALEVLRKEYGEKSAEYIKLTGVDYENRI